MGTRRLEVVISGDASSLNRALGNVQRDMGQAETASDRFSRRLGNLARAGALAGAALVGATAAVGVQELIEGEKAAARTANVIETTGGAANVTAAQVADLASQIQKLTGSEDDQIQSAANVLLTFKQIRNEAGKNNDIFNQSVEVTNDLSVALGKDLNSSAILVGKALNDPLKGMTALGRAGVQFTEQQKTQIRTLVESGDVLGAQKIILAELTSQFGGAASAEGEITEATQQAQRQFEDFAEGLAARVLPVLVDLGTFATENGDTLITLAGIAGGLGATMLAYAGALRVVAAAQALSTISSQGLFAALSLNPAALGLTAAAAVLLGGAYVLLSDRTTYTHDQFEILRASAQATADAHREVADAVDAQKDALDRLNGSNLDLEGAQLRVEEATRRVADAERDYGKNSLEARRARHDLAEAEQAVEEARKRTIAEAEEGIEKTKESSRAIDEEVEATQRRLAEARRAALLYRDNAEVQEELADAERAAGRASETAAEKHRDNAQRALELADATGTATPRARALREEYLKLAQQEFNLAIYVEALNAVSGAAQSAESAVRNFATAAAEAVSAPAPSARGGGGRGGGGRPAASRRQQQERGGPRKGEDQFENSYTLDGARGGGGGGSLDFLLGRPAPGSPEALDRVRARGDRRARTVRIEGETAARKQGKSEAEISREGERRATRAQIAATKKVISGIQRRRPALIKVAKANTLAQRIKKHPIRGTDEEKRKATDARARMKEKHDRAREELKTIARDYADAKVVLEELGERIDDLRRDDEAEDAADAQEAADKAAADAADSAEAAAAHAEATVDAAIAQAALTADPADDIAAADAAVTYYGHQYNAAVASGDPRRIADTARALKQAQDNAAQLRATKDNTEAVKENTEAQKQNFSGSVVLGYRGQRYILPSSDRLEGFL